MSEKAAAATTIMDPEFAEKVFFAGGLLAATLLLVYRLFHADEHAAAWFELRSATIGVIFGALNFRSWKLLVRMMSATQIVGEKESFERKKTAKEILLALTFKASVILLLVLFLVLGTSDHIVSMLLGFTVYLFTGMVLLVLVYLAVGGWHTVSGADHELLTLAEETADEDPQSS